MAKSDAKHDTPVDVLVLGEHPAAYLAAALLRQQPQTKAKQPPSPLRVIHATIPGENSENRLVTINPAMFDLHPLLGAHRKRLKMSSVCGVQFLADDPQTRSEHRAKTPIVCVTHFAAVRDELAKTAAAEGVECIEPKTVHIERIHERGLDVTLGKTVVHPTVLVLAGQLPVEQQAMLGMPDSWGPDVVHRFTYVRCKNAKNLDLGSKPVMPMSLDLLGTLCWAWLVPGDGEFELVVEQPLESVRGNGDGQAMLNHWAGVLKHHGVLVNPKFEIPPAAVRTADLPLAGALAHEGVANRTLLVGPAGGFYSACGEDIYPGCWSAIFAADTIKKALREPHLQDALNPYRHKWRTTLGDYLRGPQQNLRFLLPLVYRNAVMTTRLVEAILLSKSVVR
jgi:hypothetical protein